MKSDVYEDPDEFIANLRHSHPRWGGWQDKWIFRGQRQDWPLLPVLWRPSRESDPFYAAARGFAPNEGSSAEEWRRRYIEITRVFAAEEAGVDAFRRLADSLGFYIPLDSLAQPWYYWFLKHGHQEEIDNHLPTTATAIAQHHGMTTRLLDWSEDSLTAAYFAAYDWLTSKQSVVQGQGSPHTSLTDLVVYAIDYGRIERHNRSGKIALQVIRPDRAVNPFMRAQKGLFTWHRDAENIYLNSGSWPTHLDPLTQTESNATDKSNSGCLVQRLVLRSDKVDRLAEIFAKEDIRRVHLMPTLDNVAATVKLDAGWRNSKSPPELLDS